MLMSSGQSGGKCWGAGLEGAGRGLKQGDAGWLLEAGKARGRFFSLSLLKEHSLIVKPASLKLDGASNLQKSGNKFVWF